MWVRRILAIPLIILFLALFASALLVTQINEKLDDTEFYDNQMEKAGMYEFVYDEILPAALDEVEEKDTSDEIPISLSPIEGELVSAASKALPPEWLQEQFVMAADAIIPYFLGKTDEFTYTLPLRERVETAITIIKSDIINGPAFTSIHNDLIGYSADQMLDEIEDLPYTLSLKKTDLEKALKKALPQEWMAAEFEAVVDSVLPYITDESDHFTVSFNISNQVDEIADGAVDVLSGEETYDYVLDELINPTVEENIGTTVSLPFGITLTQEEITTTIKEVMPQSWVDDRLREIVSNIAAYAKSEIDSMDVTIELAEQKAQAMEILAELADKKLKAIFDELPTCSPEQFASQLSGISASSLPNCRPSGISYLQFKNALGANIDTIIADAIHKSISEEIPDQSFFTQADLQDSLGEENQNFLEVARDYVTNGWKFTENDLLRELEANEIDRINEIRDWIGNNYTFTQEDIRDEISDEGRDQDALDIFDDSREQIDRFRSWLWALWIAPILLLVGIGFLAGRGWQGRSFWALGVLFGTTLIILIAISTTYSAVGEAEIDDAFDHSERNGVELTTAEKGQEIAQNTAKSFVSGIRTDTIIIMAISLAVALGILGYGFYRTRQNTVPVAIISETTEGGSLNEQEE